MVDGTFFSKGVMEAGSFFFKELFLITHNFRTGATVYKEDFNGIFKKQKLKKCSNNYFGQWILYISINVVVHDVSILSPNVID